MNVANGYWLPLLKARGIPTVVNVDGIEWDRQKWGATAKRAFRIGASLTARHADTLICDSQAIAEIWERKFNRTGNFIPYGADPPPRTLPLPEDLRHRGYILVVARFVSENTIGEFFTAARSLSERHDVVIVGSTGYGGEFDREAAELARLHPRVRWFGHVSDDLLLQSLWSHAGAYFHGHTVGGTNPSLVQAMASGAPTVAVDTPFNRETLGHAGLFVQPDVAAITASLDALMVMPDLQIDLASKAIRRAESNYSWEGVCQDYLATLEMAAELTPSSMVDDVAERHLVRSPQGPLVRDGVAAGASVAVGTVGHGTTTHRRRNRIVVAVSSVAAAMLVAVGLAFSSAPPKATGAAALSGTRAPGPPHAATLLPGTAGVGRGGSGADPQGSGSETGTLLADVPVRTAASSYSASLPGVAATSPSGAGGVASGDSTVVDSGAGTGGGSAGSGPGSPTWASSPGGSTGTTTTSVAGEAVQVVSTTVDSLSAPLDSFDGSGTPLPTAAPVTAVSGALGGARGVATS
jgi:hypothetical protein